MDSNEELLLHAFGDKLLPTGYKLGLYKALSSGACSLSLAVAQSDKLVQV